jgi:hypothetical protein
MVLVKFHDMTIKESFRQPLQVKLWNAYRKLRGHRFSHVSVVDDGMEIYQPLFTNELEEMAVSEVNDMVSSYEIWDVRTYSFWSRSYDLYECNDMIPTCANWIWYGLTGEKKQFVTPDEVYRWVSLYGMKVVPAVGAKTT